MMPLVVCGLSGTCLLASYVADFASLLVVFFLFRMLGQGALSLLATNAVGMWFDTRLGTANGILSVLSTFDHQSGIAGHESASSRCRLADDLSNHRNLHRSITTTTAGFSVSEPA